MQRIRFDAAACCVRQIVLMGILLCGACGDLRDYYTADPAFSERTGGRKVTIPGNVPTFDLQTDCMPADLKQATPPCQVPTMQQISALSADGTLPEQALARDRFQDYLIWRSEQQCEAHKAGILGFQSSTNFVLNTVTTGAAAAAAIVTAPATSILAAIAAFTSATRSHFNEDIYAKFIAGAVVQKITTDRSQKLLEIQAKRSTQATDGKKREPVLMKDYTLEQSIGDVERYQQLCSFQSGLSSLVDPKQSFKDTAPGLKQRIDMLQAQLSDNRKLMKGDLSGTPEAARLVDVNQDIIRQIMVLQQQLLTAPLTIDTPATGK